MSVSREKKLAEHAWLTVDEAAALCNVSRRTIYNWLQADRLAVEYTPGGRLRIDPACLRLPERPKWER